MNEEPRSEDILGDGDMELMETAELAELAGSLMEAANQSCDQLAERFSPMVQTALNKIVKEEALMKAHTIVKHDGSGRIYVQFGLYQASLGREKLGKGLNEPYQSAYEAEQKPNRTSSYWPLKFVRKALIAELGLKDAESLAEDNEARPYNSTFFTFGVKELATIPTTELTDSELTKPTQDRALELIAGHAEV